MATDPKETDGFASTAAVDKLVPERPTEVVIAEMVAREPHKHGVAVEVRKRLAALRALQAGTDNWQYVYEEHCRAYNLDPEELMPGNRPRYTMGDDGEIKDHETGAIYGAKQPVEADGRDDSQGAGENQAGGAGAVDKHPDSPGLGAGSNGSGHQGARAPDPAREPVEARAPADSGSAGVADTRSPAPECEHSFPEPVEAATACTSCGLTFESWANQ